MVEFMAAFNLGTILLIKVEQKYIYYTILKYVLYQFHGTRFYLENKSP